MSSHTPLTYSNDSVAPGGGALGMAGSYASTGGQRSLLGMHACHLIKLLPAPSITLTRPLLSSTFGQCYEDGHAWGWKEK